MFVLLLAACFELPPDFENARLIEDFVQKDCGGTPYDTGVAPPVATLAASGGQTAVAVGPLDFRCAKPVQGFWIEDGDQVSVLVQPIDMNPAAVAGCDCLYDVEFTLPVSTAAVEVYTRGDNQSGRTEPALQATGVAE